MVIGIILAVCVIAIDQISKFLIDPLLPKSILGDFLWFQSTHNYGVAFSMFEGATVLFIIISSLACVVIIYLFFSKKFFTSKLKKVSLALIFAGAFSNLIDRILFGFVRDFIYLKFINYAIFNVADMSVVCGVILFLLAMILGIVNERKLKKLSDENK